MNYKITFEEMAKKGKEILSKQSPTTLAEAKAQVTKLKIQSSTKPKKSST